ncbi:MAG: hypothetical protein DRJ21_02000 [Candidatus Methanomethylicota archaeon]|uniref:Receptor ligand binding region domain-containing protein n=1 Tax=Thermoproteota archaeon TaxID=2056631 RepID=A0A497ETU1_9CREN|nr:MAG: hypothetical protein DRJ21_02000 [Candidatus Verstraetearchaeota archaeon]
MAFELKGPIAYAALLIALIVGVGIGYGVGMMMMPKAPAEVVKPGLKGKIPIGALLTLTGDLATYGENNKAALELAVKEINDWLKTRGEEWQIELIIEDTATDPKTALDKVKILHGRGVKVVIGPMTSAEVSEVKSYCEANKILVISQSSTSPALSIPGDWVYRFCPDDTIQGPAAARILYTLGIRWVIPVWRGDTWGDGVKAHTEEAFMKILKETGEEGGFHEGIRYAPGVKEFTAEVAKLAEYVQDYVNKYGADKVGVLWIGFDEAAAFVVAAKEYPILTEVVWVGSDGTAGIAPLVTVKEAAEFSWKVKWLHPVFAPTASKKYEHLKEYVKEKIGREPDSYAYAAYDALWCIAIALDLVDEYDSAKIKAVLPEVVKNYFGASGWFELNENGDRAFSDYNILIVREVSPGKYAWDLAGVWVQAEDAVKWADWFLEYVKGT